MSGGKIVLIVLAILGTLFVLAIAACGGFMWWGYSMVKDAADPRVDALFASIDDGTFPTTYDTMTTADFRATMSREEYVAMGDAIKENLGSLQSKTQTSFNVAQENGLTYADATYSAQFEKGSGEIVVRMFLDGVDWKFENFEVQSDQLPAAGDAPAVNEVEEPAEEEVDEPAVEEAVPAGAPAE
jgi:hypothetical protein